MSIYIKWTVGPPPLSNENRSRRRGHLSKLENANFKQEECATITGLLPTLLDQDR